MEKEQITIERLLETEGSLRAEITRLRDAIKLIVDPVLTESEAELIGMLRRVGGEAGGPAHTLAHAIAWAITDELGLIKGEQ